MAKENENGKLDFEEAKDMTVQEALQKHKEIEAGVTDDDGVLDKYIKQHRDQVAAEKYESQTSDFENIDTSSLDSFIQKQREELAHQGVLSKEEPEVQEQNQASETMATEQKDPEFLDETRVFAPAKEGVRAVDKTAEDDQSINDEDYLVEPEEKSDEVEDFLPEEEPY